MRAMLLLAIVFGFGCESTAEEAPATRGVPARQVSVDPTPAVQGRRVVRVHRLPVAAESGGVAMKYVDDQALPADVRDRLYANGLVVGIGRVSDLPALINLAGAEMMTTRAVISAGPGPQSVALDMPNDYEEPRPELTMFWHTRSGLSGRSFGPALPRLGVSYAEAPAGGGRVTRLTFVPKVESQIGRTVFLPNGMDRTTRTVVDESLASAGFTIDVPDDSFALFAASPEAQQSTTLGHHLLRLPNADAAMMLLFVPSRVTLEPTQGR